MSLIIETGAIVPNADSFISYEDALDEAALLGLPMSCTQEEVEQELRSAYRWIIAEYEQLFQGSRVSKEQTGSFPRNDVYVFGFSIDNDEIPTDLIYAQIAAASDMSQGYAPYEASDGKEVASEGVSSLKSSYFQSGADGSEVSLTRADKYIGPLLMSNSNSNQFAVNRG